VLKVSRHVGWMSGEKDGDAGQRQLYRFMNNEGLKERKKERTCLYLMK
jgi:hypothetical protein